MDLGEAERKEPAESVIPMINVVFLLLIFFLMSATLTPPDPLEATPPESVSDDGPAESQAALVIGAEGEVAFREQRGDAAVEAAAVAHLETPELEGLPFQLRADAQAPAKKLAQIVAALARAGVTEVALVTLAADG